MRNYLIKHYETKRKSTLLSVTVTALGNTGTTDHIGTGFDLTATFSEDSKKIPDKAELDALVKDALSSPSVGSLVNLLNNMVASNPLSSVEGVNYSTMVLPESTGGAADLNTETKTSMIPIIGALAGVFALGVVGFGATTFVRRRRTLQPGGSVSKANTLAGDKTSEESSGGWLDGRSGSNEDDSSRESFENFVRASIKGFDASSSESDNSVQNDP